MGSKAEDGRLIGLKESQVCRWAWWRLHGSLSVCSKTKCVIQGLLLNVNKINYTVNVIGNTKNFTKEVLIWTVSIITGIQINRHDKINTSSIELSNVYTKQFIIMAKDDGIWIVLPVRPEIAILKNRINTDNEWSILSESEECKCLVLDDDEDIRFSGLQLWVERQINFSKTLDFVN